MHTVSSWIKRNPLISFVLLTLICSWWPMLLYLWGIAGGVAGFGPFLGALLVLSVTEGKVGVKQWLGRMVRWRVGWQWGSVALIVLVVNWRWWTQRDESIAVAPQVVLKTVGAL